MVNILGLLAVAVAAVLLRAVLLLVGPPAVVEALAHAAGIAIGAIINYFGHSILTFKKTEP